jgi:hypothetical protein
MAARVWGHFRGHFVGYLALVVALGGTAYAADKIGSQDIKRNAVKSKHIKKNQVKSSDLKNGKAVKSADVKDGSLEGKDVRDDSLTAADLDESTLPSSIRQTLPPTSWVSAGVPSAEVVYFIGTARVEQGLGGGSSRNLHADVQVPNKLAGRSMELKSFELCYAASATAVLTELGVRKIFSDSSATFQDTTVISDETDRTDQRCRTYTPATPVVLGPNEYIEPSLSINFSGGTFNVYRTTLEFEAV